MRIVYLGIGYPVKDDQNIYTDLMKSFVMHGHTVTVVCSDVTIPDRKYRVSDENGIEVIRIQTGSVIGNVSIIRKGLSTLLMDGTFLSVVKHTLNGRKYDLILCSTPPITLVQTIQYLKRKSCCPVYLMLKDIFPQNAVDLGMMPANGLIHAYFRHMERKLYQVSDYIGCMSPANIQYVIDHNPEIPKEKVSLCVNSLENRPVYPYSRDAVLKKYKIPSDSIVFLYGGSLGVPQGIDFLVSFLRTQVNKKDRYFLICGKGKESWKLEEFFHSVTADNMSYMNWICFDDYEALQQASDVGMIFLNSRFTIPNFPSRFLSIIRNRKPVLAATDTATDLGEIVCKENMGWWSKSDDVSKLESLVDEICSAPEQLAQKGENAYSFYLENYQVENTYNQIISALNGMK